MSRGRAALTDQRPRRRRQLRFKQQTCSANMPAPAVRQCLRVLLLLLAVSTLPASSASCSSDENCSLNGVCTAAGTCECHTVWRGPSCATLAIGPAVPPLAAAYGSEPNVSSWGGNAVADDAGTFHLFVAEMMLGCGLDTWSHNSRVAHATGPTPAGPFTRADTALWHFAHNPQVFRRGDAWFIAHVGAADNQSSLTNCSAHHPPPDSRVVAAAAAPPARNPVYYIHTAPTPSGPWQPVNGTQTDLARACDNPSPLVLRNGSMLMACGKSSRWSIWSAPEPSGPWVELAGLGRPKPFGNNTGMEDPMIWQDHLGHFHILAHAFTQESWPAQMVSAHAYSRDARQWTWSTEHPFGWVVNMTDGTQASFATMERPKLAFGVDGVPTHLYSGASPQWPCAGCGNGAVCVACKGTKGRDYTLTIVRPLLRIDEPE